MVTTEAVANPTVCSEAQLQRVLIWNSVTWALCLCGGQSLDGYRLLLKGGMISGKAVLSSGLGKPQRGSQLRTVCCQYLTTRGMSTSVLKVGMGF